MNKNNRVVLYLKQEEYEELRKKAETLHLPISRYIILGAMFFNPRFNDGK